MLRIAKPGDDSLIRMEKNSVGIHETPSFEPRTIVPSFNVHS